MSRITALLVVGAVGLLGGCPPEEYPTLGPATLEEVTVIIEDADLTPQERRDELAALGFTSAAIDALLSAEPLGNQGGGDARSAYEKVVAPDFTALTPDEIQHFNTEAVAVADDYSTELADRAAQAIADLFDEFDLDSPEELEAFLDAEPDSIPTTIPDGVLEFVFIEFDADLILPRLP